VDGAMSTTSPRTDLDFEAFYKSARGRLLLQTYALTGDLPASRSAVKDAFSHAWHHWRKVSKLEDPEAWVRPHAWSHAQRLHTARIWHRDKSLDPERRATLEALGKLPVSQRRVLLLNELSITALPDMAREVGLPLAEAERQLQTATATFSIARDVPSTSIRGLLEDLRTQTEDTSWPRGSILRRAGDRRRRSHTLIGVAATVVAVLASGAIATDAGGAQPDIDRVTRSDDASTPAAQVEVEPLPESAMLDADQVDAHLPGRDWKVVSTDGNTTGDGLVMPCQRERFADPHGAAALVRTFESGRGGATVRAVQSTELSRTGTGAKRAYDAALDWFAGCADGRAHLAATYDVANVGDAATVLVLQTWLDDTRTIVAGVTRTGRLTTTTVVTSPDSGAVPARGPGGLLAAAVNTLCGEDGGGSCATDMKLRDRAPVPVGIAPGMLSEVDLPPVTGVTDPWIGTEPRQAMTNPAATQCDHTDFTGDSVSHALTRTFLVPEAERLPSAFGVTETVGTLRGPQAKAFVRRVADRVAQCAKRDLGTEVTRLPGAGAPGAETDVWRMTTELSDDKSVVYLMGTVRRGTSVAQVSFVPAPGATIGNDAFVALVRRAGERLGAMPPPA
jgi:DNA-directed RNA polymerase specialized sigma24 family protein